MIEKGAKVRIKDSEIEHFYVDFQKKVRDRVGIVTGHTFTNCHPLVTFPAVGRRKEFNAGMIRAMWLEVVEEPADTEAK